MRLVGSATVRICATEFATGTEAYIAHALGAHVRPEPRTVHRMPVADDLSAPKTAPNCGWVEALFVELAEKIYLHELAANGAAGLVQFALEPHM